MAAADSCCASGFATAQKFAQLISQIDLICPAAVIEVGKLCGLFVNVRRHVIHLRPLARIAYRQIVLGTMSESVCTASRLATAFVSLDRDTDDLSGGGWRTSSLRRFRSAAAGSF